MAFNRNYNAPTTIPSEVSSGFGYLTVDDETFKGNYRLAASGLIAFTGLRSGQDKAKGKDAKVNVDFFTNLETVGKINHSARFSR